MPEYTASPEASSSRLLAEEYELTSPSTSSTRPRKASQSTPVKRTITLHPNTSTLLFTNNTAPHQFLSDERDETVQVPDFGVLLGFNPDGEDHYEIAGRIRSPFKRRMFMLMEEPSSSNEAFAVHVMSTGTIIFSAILTILSTLPSFHTNPGSTRVLFGLDTMIVVLFTIEYLARLTAHSDSVRMCWNWASSFFGVLDLLAILPYYIEVARQQDTTILFRFSILRTFRLLRVFRAFKYQNQMLLTIEVMYVAFHRSKDALLALSFFIMLVLVFFSTLIYFAERGTWDVNLGGFVDAAGDPSSFESIPQAAWFVLVTITTVGYGEVVPRSILGRLLAVPLLVFGLLLIALPSFVLGRNFAIVFDAMTSAQHPVSQICASSDIEIGVTPRASSDSLRGTNTNLPVPNQSQSQSRGPSPIPLPRMWDDQMQAQRGEREERDLTNVKLAKNQQVLLTQIDSLRAVVEAQGETLAAVLAALEVEGTRRRRE